MKVKDKNGFQIQITDLNQAIEMAEFFKDCQHTPPQPIDKERQEYWQDMYEKLFKIKSEEQNQMSNQVNRTQYRALKIIALMVKDFEKLHYLEMTNADKLIACHARKLLEGIIQANGYKINYT